MLPETDLPITFVDLESTGADATTDRIVEIGILRVNPDGETFEYQTYVNPTILIPAGATKIHNITDETVREAPTFRQISQSLAPWFLDCHIAGYNIKRFDAVMLECEFRRSGLAVPWENTGQVIFDVLELYQKVAPRTLAGAYRQYLGKELEGAHGALADIKATYEVAAAMLGYHTDLPRDIKALSKEIQHEGFENQIDSTGKLIWGADGEAQMNFSEHKGKSIRWVYEHERKFLQWILKKGGFHPTVIQHVTAALQGQFLKRKTTD